jgi:hypothetical protein
MWELGLPPSPEEFSSHHHFYKLSCSWLLGVCHSPCLLQLACCEGFLLPPIFGAQGAPLSLLHVFFVVIVYYSGFFFFFPWVGVRLSKGLC